MLNFMYKKTSYFLAAILLLSFLVRIYGIQHQDILGDEAADSFRSIGYLDYLGTSFQTQPIDWYKNVGLPWWTKLSFHDDPPLVFLTQNIFFRFFGDSNLMAKLPSILWGVFSALLIYLIVHRFASQPLALFVTFLFSINGASIWIFRSSLLEPFLLGTLLLNIYIFFIFIDNKKHFWLFGLTLGLVALTKYTGVFILPVYICYLAFINRKLLFSWQFMAALVLAVLVFSPVIAYNFYLFKERGHFDLQLAYLFGQNTPEWTGLVGKTQDGFANILQNLITLYGLPVLVLITIALFSCMWVWRHCEKPACRQAGLRQSGTTKQSQLLPLRGIASQSLAMTGPRWALFAMLYMLFLTLMLVKIGAAPRFIVLYLPAFIILEAVALYCLWNYSSKLNFLFKSTVIGYLIFSAWFAYQINFVKDYDYGVSKLDQYFIQEFEGRESGVIPESDNQHLNNIILNFAARKSDTIPRHLSLIVYNDNITIDILEWIYYRYFFYHSIPAMYIENFLDITRSKDKDVYKDFTIYFVQSAINVPKNPFKIDKKIGDEFETGLMSKGKKPVKSILGKDSKEMFRIYKFSFVEY